MRLDELAYVSRVYDTFSRFNVDYMYFRGATSPAFDIWDARHRKELIDWLNQWGCRQFALAHQHLASKELLEWYEEFEEWLKTMDKQLWELTENDFRDIAVAFDALSARTASYAMRGEREVRKTFGPTGASKILFALCPRAMIAWDIPIRKKQAHRDSGESYSAYLRMAQSEVTSLESSCAQHGIELERIPSVLCREGATVAQIIGEFYWVTLTKECLPPTAEVVQAWARWSENTDSDQCARRA